MKVVSYVRVSDKDQVEGHSLEAQRHAIRRECEYHDYVLVAEFADEGISAHSDAIEKRPGFQAALEMVLDGRADSMIVHKMDRFARDLELQIRVLRRIDGRLISVTERLDYTTPQGKAFVHMLGLLAQFHSDNLAQEIRKGQEQRKREGLWNGRLPFGYRKQPGDDRGHMPPVADTEPVLCTVADRREWSTHDALQFMFRRAAAGASLGEIVEQLQRIGFDLTCTGVGHVLKNRFYLGELPVGRHPSRGGSEAWIKGQHEPLIDQATFDAVQRARIEHESRRNSVPRNQPTYPISGLARCGSCRGPIQCHMDTTGKLRLWCRNRWERRTCTEPSALFEGIEVQILQALEYCTPTDDIAERIAEILSTARPDVERRRQEIAEQRERLRDLYVLGHLTLEEYRSKSDQLDREVMALPAPIPASDARVLISFLRDLPAAYRAGTGAQQRDLLSRVFVELMIKDKQLVAVRPRPALERVMRAKMSQVPSQLKALREKFAVDTTAIRSSRSRNLA